MGPQRTRRPEPGAAAPPTTARVPAPAPPEPAASFAEQAAMARRLRDTPMAQIHRAPALARWRDYSQVDPYDQPNEKRRNELKAFAAVQAILRDEQLVRDQLLVLHDVARFRRVRMTDVIAEREQLVGLRDAGAVMFGNVPAAAFAATVRSGEVFDDMGAGDKHGRLSHRAQWYVVSLFVEREQLLTAYRAAVDGYWITDNPKPPPAPPKLAAWDEIVDVPWGDRGGAGAMNPETVRTVLKEVGLPERESWDSGAGVPATQPPEKKLPKELREASARFLDSSPDPTRFNDDATDRWMAQRGLDTIEVEYDGYVWSGWRLRMSTLTPTIARPVAAATRRMAS